MAMMVVFLPQAYTQIEVKNDNTVKITENVTVTRNDTDNPKLEMNLIYNVPTVAEVYMFRNYSSGVSKYRHGIANNLYGNCEYEVGLRNELSCYKLAGSSSMTKNGIFNRVYQNDATHAMGLRNFVDTGNGTQNGQTHGVENTVHLKKSTGSIFGSSNSIRVTSNVTGGNAYAINASIKQDPHSVGGAPSFSIGVKSYIDPAFNGYAGYFQGDVAIFGTLYGGSDDRLKENVRELKSGLELIKSLKPKQYNFIRDMARESRNAKTSFGFIAQEVQKVAPSLVKLIEQEGESKTIEIIPERVEVNANGEKVVIPAETQTITNMEGEPMYAIAYLEFIPFIVAAIQEQDNRMEEFGRKSLNSKEYDKDIEKLSNRLQHSQDEVEILKSQISKLIDCTNCDDIEIETRKIELQVGQLDMKLYPNPARDFVNLEISASSTGLLKISVFNESGQLVVADDMMLIEGVNVHRMESSSWTSGLYHITTTFNDVTHSQKVVVK